MASARAARWSVSASVSRETGTRASKGAGMAVVTGLSGSVSRETWWEEGHPRPWLSSGSRSTPGHPRPDRVISDVLTCHRFLVNGRPVAAVDPIQPHAAVTQPPRHGYRRRRFLRRPALGLAPVTPRGTVAPIRTWTTVVWGSSTPAP